jgi:pyridoxamine 5'-phosphate oxidase
MNKKSPRKNSPAKHGGQQNLQGLRRNYRRAQLREADVAADPMEQFARWFKQARQAGEIEPNAMVLSTADGHGAPSGRVVLLKEADAGGFVFYTNYTSRKGRQIEANPRASLTFFWPVLERQLRIEGRVRRIGRGQSEAYFHTRPRESQIGAWASDQSQVIASRQELEKRDAELAKRFGEGPIPLPDCWGGYQLVPSRIEFWQGRPGRLHDRLEYIRQKGRWAIRRLAP